MTAVRQPIPGGTVSRIRGRWQVPGLTWLTRVVLVVSLLGGFLGEPVGEGLAIAAVTAIVAAPLLRVCWLLIRWTQEHDRRFVATGVALLSVVATGGVLAALGVGR